MTDRRKRQWRDLSEGQRRLIVVLGTFEGVLKVAALLDLKRRPASQVRGSKRWWAAALVLVSSAGVVPLSYFAFGRRRDGA